MDANGYWHTQMAIDETRERINRAFNPERGQRFVIELEIGSTVEITHGSDKILAVFEGAEKNKVTLRPIDQDGKPMPYLETAERVMLSNGTDTGVAAQVWDNRRGKIVLRTLPVGM